MVNASSMDMRDDSLDYSRIPGDLDELENLTDWEVPPGEVDPRGYDLIGRDGDKIGTIKNLLASPSAERAYFAIVDTGNWFQHKLYAIPLAGLSFDPDDRVARALFTRAEFQGAPAYHAGTQEYGRWRDYWSGPLQRQGVTMQTNTTAAPLAADTAAAAPAARTAAAIPTPPAAAGAVRGEVRVPVTDETVQVHKEARTTGFVNIRKRVDVETQHISQPVTRTRVSVEEHDVAAGERSRLDPNATVLKDGETIRIPVVEEELVVEKVPHVTREVVVQSQSTTEQAERDVQLRHEHVEVDTEGDVDLEQPARAGDRSSG